VSAQADSSGLRSGYHQFGRESSWCTGLSADLHGAVNFKFDFFFGGSFAVCATEQH